MGVMEKLIHKAYTVVWNIKKPVTIGVRAILFNCNKVLLVKHSYQDSWYLPGGGVKKGETFEQAIRRELKEELGIEFKNLKLFGIYNNFYESKNDNIIIFECSDFFIERKKDKEIEKFDFFDFDNLPVKISPGTKRRLKEYQQGPVPYIGMW